MMILVFGLWMPGLFVLLFLALVTGGANYLLANFGADWAAYMALLACIIASLALYVFLGIWQKGAQSLIWEMEVPELPCEKVLLIRSVADEAFGFLGAAQFLSWATSNLWVLLVFITMKPYEWLMSFWDSRLGIRIGRFMNFKGTLGIITQLVTFFLFMLPGLMCFGLLALPVLVLTLPLFMLLCTLAVIPFGLKIAFYYPLVEMAVESTPQGKWVLHNLAAVHTLDQTLGSLVFAPLLTPSDRAYRRAATSVVRYLHMFSSSTISDEESLHQTTRRLAHSRSYQDPRALELITKFVSRRTA